MTNAIVNADVLNSWKEISNYIGRGVRTVQRWEKDFGLPVRRPSGHLRGSVLAMKTDIDGWLGSREGREAHNTIAAEPVAQLRRPLNPDWLQQLHKNARTLQERCSSFNTGTAALETTLKRTEELHETLKALRMPR